MTKLNAALSGVKIYYKNNKTEALLLDCGSNSLRTMLIEIRDAYKKTPSNPLNITELMAVMRLKGINVMRGPLAIDLEMLSRLGVLNVENNWRETLIKPNYEKINVTVDDDGRTVVRLD